MHEDEFIYGLFKEIITKSLAGTSSYKKIISGLCKGEYDLREFLIQCKLDKKYGKLPENKIKIRIVKDVINDDKGALLNLVIPPPDRFKYERPDERDKIGKIETNDYNFLWKSDDVTKNIMLYIIYSALKKNAEFRKDLVKNPNKTIKKILKEHNISIPDGIIFKVYQDTKNVHTIIIRMFENRPIYLKGKDW